MPVLPVIRLICLMVCSLFVSMVLYDAKVVSSVFSVLLLCALTIVVDLVCMNIMNLFGWDNNQIMTDGFQRAIYIVFAKIVYLIVVMIAASFLHRKGAPIGLFQIIPLLPCQLFSIYFCDLLYRMSAGNELKASTLLVLIGLLYINIVVVIFAEAIRLRVEAKHQQELATRQYEMQQKYYESLYHEQENTRALWHDINKYMIAMQSMVAMENESNASEVLDAAQEKFEQIGQVVDTNNQVLNSILNYNIQNAHTVGIPVELDVWVASDFDIKAADLSIIIGNTFDNAITACSYVSSSAKNISLIIKQKQSALLYEIKNPYNVDAPEQTGKYHGYGLHNVQACVERYGGTMLIDKNGETFSVSVRLNCPVKDFALNK